MAARGTFQITHPSKIDMTLTITMSVAEWMIVKQKLAASDSNGEWYLDAAIADMIEKANKEFHFYDEVSKS